MRWANASHSAASPRSRAVVNAPTWALLDGRVIGAEVIEAMSAIPNSSVDSIVCDPPYGIGFMGHEWDQPGDHAPLRSNGEPAPFGSGRADPDADHGLRPPGGQRRKLQSSVVSGAGHKRDRERIRNGMVEGITGGAMHAGRYDLSLTANRRYQAWCEAWAHECFRVLKPGGHLLASCGTRTYHRLASGIEDAGFEIRDSILWLYGQGFPKSMNVGCQCGEGQPETEHDLRPVREADLSEAVNAEDQSGEVLLSSVSQSGASASRAVSKQGPSGEPESGMEGRRDHQAPEGQLRRSAACTGAGLGATDGESGRLHSGASAGYGEDGGPTFDEDGSSAPSRSQSVDQQADQLGAVADKPGSQVGGGWPLCPRCGKPTAGLGTALKPAHEEVVVARKPLIGTVVTNVLAHGTGAINVAGCQVGFASEVDEQESKEKNRHADFGSGARDNHIYGEDKAERGNYGNYDAQGRWPANVILSHVADCTLIGTAEVDSDGHFPADRGPSGYGSNGHHPNSTGGLRGQEDLNERHMAGELVELWECAPGCPVATLDAQSGVTKSSGGGGVKAPGANGIYGSFDGKEYPAQIGLGDAGGASRFFYVAKCSRAEREAGLRGVLPCLVCGQLDSHTHPSPTEDDPAAETKCLRNNHPTVKPIDLDRHLVRLVTPPGGLVLVPFLGSGSESCAALLEGFETAGIEREDGTLREDGTNREQYTRLATARIEWWEQHRGLEAEEVLKVNRRLERKVKEQNDSGQLGLEIA